MRALVTHVWKEWRDHRAVLLGILVAIPVLTVIGCLAFSEQIVRLALAAPAFVGGATVLTVLALSTELWAGESRRDTLAFSRRLPRGLARAFAAKTLFYLVACAGTAAYAAVVLLGVGRALGGVDVGADVARAVTSDAMTFALPAAGTAFGLWILLVLTWIPRGAAAAGAAALLLGLLALPAYLMHAAHPTYGRWIGAVPAVAIALVVVPVALTALCSIRGLRFVGGTWSAAWRGLSILAVVATGGYAYAAHELASWVHLTPDDPDMRIPYGYLGAGGRLLYLNAGRTAGVRRGLEEGSLRPWVVDLETGAWRELSEPGRRIGVAEGIGDCWSTWGERGVGLLSIRAWKSPREDVRYVDGTTGFVVKTLPADVTTPDLRERIVAERRRLTPVHDASGRPMWYSAEANAIERLREDGSVESLPLAGRHSIPQAFWWGWTYFDGKQTVVFDARATDPRVAIPWRLPELPTGEWNRLGADRYLGMRVTGPKERRWFVADTRAKTVTEARGIEEGDALILTLADGVIVQRTDVHAEPHVSRLFRVEPLSGERVEIPLPRGVEGPAMSASVAQSGVGARGVFVVVLPSRARGLAHLDDEGRALVDWTPVGDDVEVLSAPMGGTLLLVVEGRRIERARWGTPDREVLFPRAR